MAVVNQYKFVGVDNSTTGSALTPFGSGVPVVNETIVIKSILVTSAATPTVTIINNSITAIKSAQLTANTTTELLTQPLIVEGGTSFTVQSSTTDSFDVAISYLNIKKEVTT
jgi:hypothetical protein